MVTTVGKIARAAKELNLEPMLLNGQAFRWIKHEPDVYYGVAYGRLWRLKRCGEDSHVSWNVVARSSKCKIEEDSKAINKYLHMDSLTEMEDLYKQWTEADERFEKFLQNDSLKGIRILDQEPLECLLSFICSANNNIKRISKLVNRLAVLYGDRFDEVIEEDEYNEITTLHPYFAHAFPSLDQFRLEGMEQQLRQDGFGYRAAYIRSTIERLREVGGEESLEEQKSAPVKDAKAFLMSFAGIGPKVADCIMLMSLGHASVVPLDVHMWNITRSLYLPSLPAKAATSRYEEVAAFYLSKFGSHAGWAQAVLFNAQLGKTDKKAATEDANVEGKKKRRKK